MLSESINYNTGKSVIFKILPAALFISLLAGCSFKTSATGLYENVVVFADDSEWDVVEDVMKNIYEREIITPQKEVTYTLLHAQLEARHAFEKHRTVVLIGAFESEGEVGKIINSLLTPQERNALASLERLYVQKRDVWANNQYILIIAASTIQELLGKLTEHSDELFYLVDQASKNYQKLEMYEDFEQLDLAAELFDKYGFTFRIQHDYFIKEWPDSNTVFFRRFLPDRMITIHWVDTTDVGFITEDWVIKKRQEIGINLLDGRVMDISNSTFEMGTYTDYSALVCRGIWVNYEEMFGGPMSIYTFYDETTSRIYMIDLSVYAPELSNEKMPFIRQLEIIAGTFTTNPRNTPF